MTYIETPVQEYLRAPFPHDKKYGPYADITARDAIPTEDRYPLMTVGVLDDGSGNNVKYRLLEGLTNDDWELESTSSILLVPNTWYINTNGSDSNVGSDKFPFENPQTALDAAASGDIIIIQDVAYSKSGAFAFSKDVTIVGPAGYNPTNAAKITGQFTITGGASLQFQNIHLGGVSIISTVGDTDISIYNSRLLLTAATANAIDLYLSNCEFDTSAEITLRSLIMRGVEGSGFKLNTELTCHIFFSNWATDIEVGTGGASSCNLRGATLGGALTVTGNLSNENSTIAGTVAVSGTTTSGQAKVFDDPVLFKGQATANIDTTITYEATPNFDFNNGNDHKISPITGNISSWTTSNEKGSGTYKIWFVNDGSVRTVAAPTGWTIAAGSDTHSTAANAVNLYQLYTDPENTIKKYFIIVQ